MLVMLALKGKRGGSTPASAAESLETGEKRSLVGKGMWGHSLGYRREEERDEELWDTGPNRREIMTGL